VDIKATTNSNVLCRETIQTKSKKKKEGKQKKTFVVFEERKEEIRTTPNNNDPHINNATPPQTSYSGRLVFEVSLPAQQKEENPCKPSTVVVVGKIGIAVDLLARYWVDGT